MRISKIAQSFQEITCNVKFESKSTSVQDVRRGLGKKKPLRGFVLLMSEPAGGNFKVRRTLTEAHISLS